jgi:hypothetical protein
MPRYSWTVEYNGTTNLQQVQNITITRGRTQVQDPFKAATATISGRNLATLPTITIGAPILIRASEPLNIFVMFHGVVSDVQINYGTVPAMDTWTINCEDVLARLGRGLAPTGSNWSGGVTTLSAAASIIGQAFNNAISISGLNTGSLVSAQNPDNENVLQLVNQLAATEQGYIYGISPTSVGWVTRSEYGSFPLLGVFSDSGFPGPNTTFSDVTFRSQADSFYDVAVIEPVGLASQTSGSGPRVFTMTTYDQTTSQAKNLADYVLATLQVQTTRPSTISVLSETQDNNIALNCARRAGTGIRCALSLRGVNYTLFVEGSTVTATPEQTRFTLNVVSADALNFFILDDASFGVLDTNKLGF